MTEQDLREKIVDVIIANEHKGEKNIRGETIKKYLRIADALIAAGIGDVSEYKHKAEVAEKAAFNILNNTLQCVDCVVLKEGKCKVDKKDIANCAIKSLDIALKQAEKELQEEK